MGWGEEVCLKWNRCEEERRNRGVASRQASARTLDLTLRATGQHLIAGKGVHDTPSSRSGPSSPLAPRSAASCESPTSHSHEHLEEGPPRHQQLGAPHGHRHR